MKLQITEIPAPVSMRPFTVVLLAITLNVFWNNFFSSRWGLGDFLMWWPPSTMWADPLIYLWPSTGDVWIIPPLWIWDYVLHVSCVITNCGQHQWAIPSPLNSSLGFAGGKHNQKLLSLSLDLFFKILLFQVAFLTFFSIAIFSPYFFSAWFLIAVCGSISVQGTR